MSPSQRHSLLPCEVEPHRVRKLLGPDWGRPKMHPTLGQSQLPLLLITWDAGDDDVRPVCLPTLGPWDDVVIRHVVRTDWPAAVLTTTIVPGIDVLTRELDHALLSRLNGSNETDDRRHLEFQSDGSNDGIVALNDFDFVLEQKGNCSLPTDFGDGGEALTQYETLHDYCPPFKWAWADSNRHAF